jgi:hypothetical protein
MINPKKDKIQHCHISMDNHTWGTITCFLFFLPYGLPNILLYNKLVKEVIWVQKKKMK